MHLEALIRFHLAHIDNLRTCELIPCVIDTDKKAFLMLQLPALVR